MVGGITADRRPSAVVERFDPREGTWQRLADLPRAVHHAGAVGVDGRVMVVGGLDADFRGVADCHVLEPPGNWKPIAPQPVPRGACGVAVLDGRIYVAGGQDGSTSTSVLAVYTPDDGPGSWQLLPPMPTARNHLAAVAAGGYFYAISGRSGGRLREELERYDPRSRTWSALAPIPTPRGGIAAVVIGGGIHVLGGEGNLASPEGVFPEHERYDPGRDEWSVRAAMSVPRHGIGAALVGDRVFIPGGAGLEGFSVTPAHTAYLPREDDLPRFRRGDVRGDGGLDIADVLALAFFVVGEAPAPGCLDSGDVDDDGEIRLDDAVALLRVLFLSAPPPPEPFTETGGDSSPDLLGCESGEAPGALHE